MESQAKDCLDKRFIDNSYKEIFGQVFDLGNWPEVANFGEGMPDMQIPDFLIPALNEAAAIAGNHQYTRTGGHPDLVVEVAKRYGKLIGREINPLTEVIICEGASDAFYGFLEAYIQPGDEIVAFEPCFGYYLVAMKLLKNATIKPVCLMDEPNFMFNWEKFESAFSEKTRCLYLNTPHNPTGKVFKRTEMERISKFLQENYPKVIVFADNVYRDIHFGDSIHTEISSLPGMWQRTLTSYSFGKTFGATGWRLGLTVGPAEIIDSLSNLQMLRSYCGIGIISAAAALVLQRAELPYKGEKNYYEWLNKFYLDRYQKISEIIRNSGLNIEPEVSGGGFYLFAKIDKAVVGLLTKYFYKDLTTNEHGGKQLESAEDWKKLENIDYTLDAAYCHYLASEFNCIFLPASAFFSTHLDPPKSRFHNSHIRISLCKSDESLDRLRNYLSKGLTASK